MSDMRETKITKRQNTIKRGESLHIHFQSSASVLWFFYCLLLLFLSPVSVSAFAL